MRVFLAKNRKTLKVGKIRNYDEKTVFFEKKKTFSSTGKLFLQKWEGAKYPGGNRPSRFTFLLNTVGM